MKIVNASFTVRPGWQPYYEHFIEEMVERSRQENGNVSYDHYKKMDVSNEYEIIEQWADDEALETHKQSANYKEFWRGIGHYVKTEPTVTVLDH
ncbi:antibiotic biosynthesis monooxygenase [Ligilactobacillus pobuzihii]|uniref:putative quinol monooxygenase n=1 Tax=Ligilactobacillus pobuzihii TaxID=449659 RepID=UPI0019CFB987|nr:putative quinol monooxygenase [Ligilactobacillus pobuzihii]MBN7274032.1 antibiotic biosynthesis monooxygenase [Ligilactobacillus pobuzihii]